MIGTCSLSGCTLPLRCRGYCRMHYKRLLKRGNPGAAGREKAEWGAGTIDSEGYRVLTLRSHPLAQGRGRVYEHRAVLFDTIGAGAHECHWCGTSVSWMSGTPATELIADHVDGIRLNNRPANLVPSCIGCNVKRGQ